MPDRGNILLLGATGGVGKAAAIMLKEAGFNVIATCRSKDQQKLLVDSGICNRAVQLDLASDESIEAAFGQLQAEGVDRLAGVINCAAVANLGALETMSQEDVRDLFQTNVFGTLLTAQLAIPLLRKAQGRLIMVGSVGGSLALPLLGAYSASKFAIEAICDVLRRELEPWNIHVSMVNPGAITTSMAKNQISELQEIIADPGLGIDNEYLKFYKRHKKAMMLGYEYGVTAERVAEDICTAMTDLKPKARYLPGLEPAIVSRLSKYLPDTLKDRILKTLSSDD